MKACGGQTVLEIRNGGFYPIYDRIGLSKKKKKYKKRSIVYKRATVIMFDYFT